MALKPNPGRVCILEPIDSTYALILEVLANFSPAGLDILSHSSFFAEDTSAHLTEYVLWHAYFSGLLLYRSLAL